MTTNAWKVIAAFVVLAVLVATAYGLGRWWGHPDMARQPSVGPQQSLVRLPAGAIPQGRNEPFSPPSSTADLVLARLSAGSARNPVPADEASLVRGRTVYEIHCQVCHGTEGRGDGPVGLLFIPPPMDLTAAYVRGQPDGQLFYTITYGSLVMPAFYDSIPVQDRWHVVNYLQQIMGTQ